MRCARAGLKSQLDGVCDSTLLACRYGSRSSCATPAVLLQYRPVIIHRAILGSVERMFAILCENFGGTVVRVPTTLFTSQRPLQSPFPPISVSLPSDLSSSFVRAFSTANGIEPAGKWPFWLSPRQALVIPIHPKFTGYAEKVARRFHLASYAADVDMDQSTTLMKKIRNACVAQVCMPYTP